MKLGLDGYRVLVTGGAGGIGSAVVRAFARERARVAVHYRSSAQRAQELARDIDGVAFQADLTDEDETEALFDRVVEDLGGVDVCVANAGFWPREDVPVAAMPLTRWRDTIDANLTLTFLTARAFVKRMTPDRSPSLVLIGSTAGLFGEAGHADYAAAKAAISRGLLLSLKNEVTRSVEDARVNVVAPGWTVSPMTERDLDDETVEHATATMALRKVGRPEDVARTVVWLASPLAAGHVTGEVVTVAGGMEGRLLHPPSPPPREPV